MCSWDIWKSKKYATEGGVNLKYIFQGFWVVTIKFLRIVTEILKDRRS